MIHQNTLSTFVAFPLLIQQDYLVNGLYTMPQYAMIVISGVLLALVFQIIFMVLSVSLGISSIGDLRKKFVKASNHTQDADSDKDKNNYEFSQDYNDNGMGMAEGISTAFGIWSMITTSLSLLFGTILALNLTVISTFGINVTLALVIWALFFLILFYLEIKFAQTVIGGLFSAVVGAIKGTSNTIKEMFTSSKQNQMEDTIDHSIEKIRKELLPNFNAEKISGVLDKFFKRVEKKMPDYDTLKKDITTIVEENKSSNNTAKWMAVQQVLAQMMNDDTKSSSGNMGSLQKLAKEIQEQVKQQGSVKDGAAKVAADHTSYSKEEIDQAVEKVKSFITQALPSNLTANKIQEELHRIVSGEKNWSAAITTNMSFSREDLVRLLQRNTNIPKDQLETYADTVQNALTNIKETFSKNDNGNFTKKVEDKLKSFLNMDSDETLDANALKNEFVYLINHPQESFGNIKKSITRFNKKDFESFLTRNNLVSKDKLNSISNSYQSAVEEVKSQIEDIEIKARQTYEMTKRKAVIQAEHARKTAAMAAWWLLITILVAGATSVAGVYIF